MHMNLLFQTAEMLRYNEQGWTRCLRQSLTWCTALWAGCIGRHVVQDGFHSAKGATLADAFRALTEDTSTAELAR